MAAVGQFAARQFLLFFGCDGIDGEVRDAEPFHDLFIEHPDAAGRDGAHRQFPMARHAELAHDKDVERRVKFACDFKGYGQTIAWESQRNDVVRSAYFVSAPAAIGRLALGRSEGPRAFSGTAGRGHGHVRMACTRLS